jgi:UDP-GlcNAc:undecaprenyl-phosphate/decaprenyl-phosphate GlcNAc-1-phosphate transferase
VSLIAALLGVGAGVAVWTLTVDLFSTPALRRVNRRGIELATAGGLVVLLASLGAAAVVTLAEDLVEDTLDDRARAALLVAVLGFGLLGLLDDLVGTERGGGFRGHLQALAGGHMTTGAAKLIGGSAVAVVAAGLARDDGFAWLLVDAVLVAAAANLANLFDLVPGRATKVAVVAWVALIVAVGVGPELAAVSFVVGATAGLLRAESTERLMMGDTGANVVGAALGVGAVACLGQPARLSVAVLVVSLNLASEVVSFSRVIDRFTPLRWLDGLGRPD